MIIELEEPFKSLWDKAYLVTSTDGRKRVHFVKNGKVVAGMSYARYQMSVSLGSFISPDLEVDHKDNDKTNDVLGNYQLLTKSENIKKQTDLINSIKDQEPLYGYTCHHCDTNFLIDEKERNKRLNSSKTGLAFCSHKCSVIFTSQNNFNKSHITEDLITRIKNLRSSGKSSYIIAGELGISRNTVMKYW